MAEENKTTDFDGVEVEVGIDGENPVTPNNPPAKAQSEEQRGEPRQGQDANEFEPHTYAGAETSADRPDDGATKGEWVDYAVAQGAARDEAESSTKKDLIEAYG